MVVVFNWDWFRILWSMGHISPEMSLKNRWQPTRKYHQQTSNVGGSKIPQPSFTVHVIRQVFRWLSSLVVSIPFFGGTPGLKMFQIMLDFLAKMMYAGKSFIWIRNLLEPLFQRPRNHPNIMRVFSSRPPEPPVLTPIQRKVTKLSKPQIPISRRIWCTGFLF